MLGLIVRSPWHRLPDLLTEHSSLQALRLSLYSATMATLVSLVLGVPLAWALARLEIPGKRLLRAFVTVPLVLPPVVGGVALLLAFGRRGLIGGPVYDHTGWSLPFTTTAVIVAEAFVAMPFLIVTVEGALRAADQRFEEAAATLGASRLTVLRRVSLPMIMPSVVAGAVLSWARALGEFGATITFAGNFPGRTQTLPLSVYLQLEQDPSAAFALSLILLGVSIVVLVVLRGRWLPGAVP
jgi:molybdate transport system permease protein